MGTDVYLEWNERADEEKEAQVTGFAIGAGDYGYLSASIDMVRENLWANVGTPVVTHP